MEQGKELNEWLEVIGHETGDIFQCDAEAIAGETSRHNALFSNIGIRALSVIGGFAAGCLFLVFLFLSGILESETSMTATGVIFIAGALVASRLLGNHTFLDAAFVSVYIIGCALLAIGSGSETNACTFFILTALVTLIVTEKYVLVFISVLLLNGSIAFLYIDPGADEWLYLHTVVAMMALTGLCASEASIISISPKVNLRYKPVVAGLFVSLATILLGVALQHYWGKNDNVVVYGQTLSVFTWMGIMYLVWQITRICDFSGRKRLIFCALMALVILPTFYAPAISGAVFMILLSFRYNYKPAFAISIILLIYTLTQYYYDLSITLLVKSGILFFSGILFLCMWWLFHKTIKKDDNSL